ncbi:hypothetical protein [Plantactinospora soyae]|uniref:Uncharacterized protein n=1 Tax=Plantactinospora soyae TaxID=1544732 RepID=A0A927MF99_9ACTN|nr:hypothetical protein [Plantactinospora soyae]MBE1492702.1 hypothetical protein [Plantactinospora soyae]
MTGTSGVPPLAAALLRLAGRRWPAELRTEMLQEWQAEVAAIGADPTRTPVVRALRQLRFAISLAGSPPVEDEYGVPRGWREYLPGVGRTLQPLLMLLGAVLLCLILATVFPRLGSMLLSLARGYPSSYRPDGGAGIDWAATAVALAGLAVAAGTAGWLGAWSGRRLPVDWAHRTRLGVAGSAVIAPIVMAGGTLAMYVASRAGSDLTPQEGVTILEAEPVLPVLLWVALLAPLAGATAWIIHRVRRRVLAVTVAVLGGLVALDLTAIVAGRHAAIAENVDFDTALWWFPMTLLAPDGGAGSFGPVGQGSWAIETVVMIVTNTLHPLLTATAFVLCYGVSAARPRLDPATAPAPAPAPAPASTGTTAAAVPVDGPSAVRLQRFGLAVVAIGLGLWTYGLTVLTPGLSEVAAVDEVQSWELHLWAQELRQAGVVLAVLGLIVAAAGRGPVLLPGLLGGAVLLPLDSFLDAADLTGPGTVPGTLGLGVAVLTTGWWLSGVLGDQGGRATPRGRSEPAVPPGPAGATYRQVPLPEVRRRRLAWVSAMAALCAPALLARASGPDALTPAGYPTVTAITVGMLTALAMVTALAVRGDRLPLAVAVPAVGTPVLALVVLGGLTGGLAWEIGYAAALGTVLVAVVLAVMTMRRRPRAVPRWIAVGIGAVVLGPPLMYAEFILASPAGEPLMRAAGYGRPVDGLPFLPGAVLLAVPLAVVLATRVVPSSPSRVRPTFVPSPRGHDERISITGNLGRADG